MKKMLLILLLTASTANAAYTVATPRRSSIDNPRTILVEFTGAGEQPVRREKNVGDGLTLEAWAARMIAELNRKSLDKGSVVYDAPLVLPVVPTPTALDIAYNAWAVKVARLTKLKTLPITPTAGLTSAIASLQADIDATFQVAFIPRIR